jgi:hypothetical protein
MPTFIHVCRTVSKYTANNFEVDRWINTDLIDVIERDKATCEVVAVTEDGTAYIVDSISTYSIDEVLNRYDKPKPPKPDNCEMIGRTNF